MRAELATRVSKTPTGTVRWAVNALCASLAGDGLLLPHVGWSSMTFRFTHPDLERDEQFLKLGRALLKKRIIPLQILLGRRLVKTERFSGWRDVSGPLHSDNRP
jgi:hypothetical protein